MFALEHRVRVFVFQVLEQDVRYLLLRQKPRNEWPLGPVIGAIGIGEQIEDAVRREVEAETGIQRPVHILEIAKPHTELFGDVGLVEWPFAYQAGTPHDPTPTIRPGPQIGEFAWLSFEAAFQRIGSQSDRDDLVKLQLHLQS
jgi:8-oxo-dGTP pyrophosphatase MutT (NUDIX family)